MNEIRNVAINIQTSLQVGKAHIFQKLILTETSTFMLHILMWKSALF